MTLVRNPRRLVPLLYAAVGIAASVAAIAALQAIQAQRGSWALAPLAVAVALFAAQIALLTVAWHVLLGRMNAPRALPMRRSATTFLLGWLSRYLPGPPTGPAGKYVAARNAGLAMPVIAGALFYEQVLQLAATVAVPSITLGFYTRLDWHFALGPLGCLVAALLVIGPACPPTFRFIGRAWEGRGSAVDPIPLRTLIAPTLLMTAAGGFAGIAFHVVAWTMTGWPLVNVGEAVFIFSVASLAGFVIPFLPSGAGVRELIIVALLGPQVGAPEAAAVAVVCRAVAVLLDATLGASLLAIYAGRTARERVARLPSFAQLVKKRA